MAKFFTDNSRYLEAVSDIADKVVHAKFGDACMVWDEDGGSYTDEAQDLFNETSFEVEVILQKTLGVHSINDLDVDM
jgi:hypothetical protein